MPTHKLEMTVPANTLIPVNSDWTLRVHSGDRLLGTLEISRGSIDWRPRKNSVVRYSLTWEAFDQLMYENGREKRRQ